MREVEVDDMDVVCGFGFFEVECVFGREFSGVREVGKYVEIGLFGCILD